MENLQKIMWEISQLYIKYKTHKTSNYASEEMNPLANEKQYFVINPFLAFVCEWTFVQVANDIYDKESCAKTLL